MTFLFWTQTDTLKKEEWKQLMDESLLKAGECNDAIKAYYDKCKKSGKPLTTADLHNLAIFKNVWSREMKTHKEARKQFLDRS